MILQKWSLPVAIFALAGCRPVAAAPPMPGETQVFDVTAHGAKPGDGQDDTAAIQAAIAALLKQKNGPGSVHARGPHTLYFPDGTYQVGAALSFGDRTPNPNKNPRSAMRTLQKQIHIKGQSRGGAVIQLAAGVFKDANRPAAVVNLFAGNGTNDLFSNTVEDLTIVVGPKNPGAIGLNFHNNNCGAVRRVTIRSQDGSGYAGLRLGGGVSGIGLVQDVRVEGFDYGITNGDVYYPGGKFAICYVLENIALSGQSQAGIWSQGKGLSIRRLSSDNRVPALLQDDRDSRTKDAPEAQDDNGLIALIDADLKGGAPDQAAIDNRDGWIVARNVQASGYGATLRESNNAAHKPVAATFVNGEYATGGALRLWDDVPAQTLNLPVQDAPPSLAERDPSRFVVVDPAAQEDDTLALQNAINAGKPVVYLKQGVFRISDTILLGGAQAPNFRRLMGNWARLTMEPGLRDKPVFRIPFGGSPEAITFEAVDVAFQHGEKLGDGFRFFQHDSGAPLVLRDLFLPNGPSYRSSGGGDVWVENVASGGAGGHSMLAGWVFSKQRVWARQINPEGYHPHFRVENGAQVWILGFKTEQRGPMFEVVGGSRLEVLGGVLNSPANAKGVPSIIVDDSRVSMSVFERTFERWGPPSGLLVRETRGGQTREMLTSKPGVSGAPRREDPTLLGCAVMPLYVSGTP